MIQDIGYRSEFRLSEKKHHYGSHIHLLDDPYATQVLNRFSQASVSQPEANRLVTQLYKFLLQQSANTFWPRVSSGTKTRMLNQTANAHFEGEVFNLKVRAVVVDLMRAGILPTQVCFEALHDILAPADIRQDHILINRKTNDQGEVIGVNISGHKIGGPFDNSYVFIPDPMGATGSSMRGVIELLEKFQGGAALKFIGLHLIVTPEYLKSIEPLKDRLEIFTLRLDRGLSSKEVLSSIPGTHWDQEKGLTDNDYIVPGAGGVGEILNNSFV